MELVKMSKDYLSIVANFDSGNSYLDTYIRTWSEYKNQNEVSYLLLESDSSVVGYFSISAGSLDNIDITYRGKMGGAVHINNFAIVKDFQGLTLDILEDGSKFHFSDYLLQMCLGVIYDIRKLLGINFVTLCSTSEGEHFYERNAFEYLEDDMILSIGYEEKKCKVMYRALDIE